MERALRLSSQASLFYTFTHNNVPAQCTITNLLIASRGFAICVSSDTPTSERTTDQLGMLQYPQPETTNSQIILDHRG